MDFEQKVAALSARVRVLEDESAIRNLMAAMMAKADDRDNPRWPERMVENYTADGMWTSASGFSDVGMRERGHAALAKKFTAGTRIRESSHLLGTESIAVSGDEAEGTWLCFEPATLETEGDGREAVWVMGRYHCEFRREDNGWKVRTVRFEGIFCTPYDQGWAKERFTSISPLAAG